jgi:sporulation protein YlmC with PRC-barrel domain
MVVIKHTSLPIEKTIKLSEILGKKVISSGGQKIGSIGDIHIHPERLSVEGITVGKGVFAESDYIGSSYIKSLTREGAMLNIVPSTRIEGLDVYDVFGKKIGKVKSVNRSRKTNQIVSVAVAGSSGEQVITKRMIHEIGKNIVLNKFYKKKK